MEYYDQNWKIYLYISQKIIHRDVGFVNSDGYLLLVFQLFGLNATIVLHSTLSGILNTILFPIAYFPSKYLVLISLVFLLFR